MKPHHNDDLVDPSGKSTDFLLGGSLSINSVKPFMLPVTASFFLLYRSKQFASKDLGPATPMAVVPIQK